jgi:C4-dicarboxylate-specific signal transduction histidine kinase
LVAEGLAGHEAFELGTTSAAVGFFYAVAEQSVILSAQVVVRIEIRRLTRQCFAGWA